MAANAKAAQDFVPIKEIRDGVVVLKDKSLRAVVMASSLNFALKSAQEQEAIIVQFQNFLNSVEFPLQFAIQSRDLDIRPYIALLEERYTQQINDLIKLQTREYIEFIRGFTENVNIMAKTFFVVVPYTPSIASRSDSGVIGSLKKQLGRDTATEKASVNRFDDQKAQLDQRVSVVEQGLGRTGVRTVRLGTEELVELFHKTFNPGELEKPIQLSNQ